MAEKTIIKYVILLVAFPFYLTSLIAEYFNIWNIKNDLVKCSKIINQYKSITMPYCLLESLVVAEDRRNAYHIGIDPIAMIRAISVKVIRNEFQGASTIEQQFVRVVSNRYERKISRKFREQILALVVSRKFSKNDIAKAYLCIAFYGPGKIGIKGIHRIAGKNIEKIKLDISVSIISRLKYPEPLNFTQLWEIKHQCRNEYIKKRLETKKGYLSMSGIKNAN